MSEEQPKWVKVITFLWEHKETLAEAAIVLYLALQQVGVL